MQSFPTKYPCPSTLRFFAPRSVSLLPLKGSAVSFTFWAYSTRSSVGFTRQHIPLKLMVISSIRSPF